MKGLPRSLAHAKAGTEVAPKRVTYNIKNLTVNVTGGASTALGFGSAVLGGLPEGNILVLGGIAYVQLTSTDADVIATFGANIGIGTTPVSDATLTNGDVDVVSDTDMGTASAKATALVRKAATASLIDNTANDLELNLNVLTDDNSVTDSLVGTFLANGVLELVYIVLGDD
jgi:hypothetical protein